MGTMIVQETKLNLHIENGVGRSCENRESIA